jgi:hypothetical protein
MSADDQLVDAIDLEPIEGAEELRPLDAGRPHHELRGDELADRQADAVGPHLTHLRARTDFDAEIGEQAECRLGDTLRQGRQDAVGRFE